VPILAIASPAVRDLNHFEEINDLGAKKVGVRSFEAFKNNYFIF